MLIWVLAIQRVHGYIKIVKYLFIEVFASFILIDSILLIRRVLLPDMTAFIISDKLIYTITFFALAAIGQAATIIYVKPRSSSCKDIYTAITRGGKILIPFLLFISIIIISTILIWIFPIRMELSDFYPYLYVPVHEIQQMMISSILFLIFLLYPVALLLMASYATKDRAFSHELRIFAICIIGLGVSNYLQPFFVTIAEILGVIQIPCFIAITYVLRRITTLQNLQDVELREYIARLKLNV